MSSQKKTSQVKSLLARTLGKEQILDMVATGWTLAKIGQHASDLTGTPISAYYVCRYLQTFGADYEAAKKAQAQMHAERVATIADDVEQGKLDPASARVASENRKWVAGKLDSAYSDRAALDIQVTNVADMHLLALRERMRLEAKTVEDTRLLAATEQ